MDEEEKMMTRGKFLPIARGGKKRLPHNHAIRQGKGFAAGHCIIGMHLAY
ncbi:MAG: hypothetical protein JXD19_02795 [Deltaproteobacteria bacterium]|nr:hypothetical protein [Deltaproteobacteria bacterium]